MGQGHSTSAGAPAPGTWNRNAQPYENQDADDSVILQRGAFPPSYQYLCREVLLTLRSSLLQAYIQVAGRGTRRCQILVRRNIRQVSRVAWCIRTWFRSGFVSYLQLFGRFSVSKSCSRSVDRGSFVEDCVFDDGQIYQGTGQREECLDKGIMDGVCRI